MKKIILVSLVFFNVCYFNAQSFFGNKVESKKFVMMISPDNTDAEIKNKIDFFKEKLDVDVKVENIKRDKDNKITSLNFSYKDKYGNQGQSNISEKTPIKGIRFAYDRDDDNKVDIQLSTNKNTPLINRSDMASVRKKLNTDDDFIRFFDNDTLNKSPFSKSYSKSAKIIIDKDGNVQKSITENGEPVEESESFSFGDDIFNFSFSGSEGIKELMEKMKSNSFTFNFDDLSDKMPSMKDLQEQIEKMKAEMDEMKKDLKSQKNKK